MSKKPKVIKAWGLVSIITGEVMEIRHSRAQARRDRLMHENVRRVSVRILPNAQNRKSA